MFSFPHVLMFSSSTLLSLLSSSSYPHVLISSCSHVLSAGSANQEAQSIPSSPLPHILISSCSHILMSSSPLHSTYFTKMPQNPSVTAFVEGLSHPHHDLIELLRTLILSVDPALEETVKWNAPSYALAGADRLTLALFPPKSVRLVFHRGVFKTAAPAQQMIDDPLRLLEWKGTDRAVATFRSVSELEAQRAVLSDLIRAWLAI
ncbi:MAG: DUF1801 domain-containing protein [Chitinophagaceae bacterium]|nr:MAG: DUF1801 domain-containing protein [Chitinophagaceae bacterium]